MEATMIYLIALITYILVDSYLIYRLWRSDLPR